MATCPGAPPPAAATCPAPQPRHHGRDARDAPPAGAQHAVSATHANIHPVTRCCRSHRPFCELCVLLSATRAPTLFLKYTSMGMMKPA